MRSLTVTHHKPEASGDLSTSMSFCVQLRKNGRTSDGHLSVIGVHPKNPTTRVHAPTVQALDDRHTPDEGRENAVMHAGACLQAHARRHD